MAYSTVAPSLTQKSLQFYRAVKFSWGSVSHFRHHAHLPATPIRTSVIRSYSDNLHYYPLNCSHAAVFKDLRCSGVGFNHIGSGHFRVSAMAGDGSGGYGSTGSGNSGGGGEGSGSGSGSGSDGAGGGGEKWSLLSWYYGAFLVISSGFCTFFVSI